MTRVWLGSYWLAALVGLLSAMLFGSTLLTVSGEVETYFQVLSLTVGSLALMGGAGLATALAVRGVETARFVRGTSAIRTNAIAWMGSFVLVVGWVIQNSNSGASTGSLVGDVIDSALLSAGETVTALLGFGSALLLLGPGLGEFAEAARSERDRESVPPSGGGPDVL